MIPCAAFPILPTTAPIIRHIIKSSTMYSITTVLTFPGTGIEGQDGSVVDCREPLGLNIQVDITKEPHKWYSLLVFDHEETSQPNQSDQYTAKIITSALKMHKNVICAKRFPPDVCEHFKAVGAENNSSFKYLPENWKVHTTKRRGALTRLQSFYILFGSIISDASSLDVSLSCFEALSKTHRVSFVSTEENSLLCGANSIVPIVHAPITETERVYEINRYLADIENRTHPEITILHLAEPVLAFDDTEPNGFGIIPYILSKSVPTHAFLCSIPFLYNTQSFIEHLNNGIIGQYGYPVDGICLSNVLLDSTSIAERKRISVVYMKSQFVESWLASNRTAIEIPTYNNLNANEKQRLLSDVESFYSDFMMSRVIP